MTPFYIYLNIIGGSYLPIAALLSHAPELIIIPHEHPGCLFSPLTGCLCLVSIARVSSGYQEEVDGDQVDEEEGKRVEGE